MSPMWILLGALFFANAASKAKALPPAPPPPPPPVVVEVDPLATPPAVGESTAFVAPEPKTAMLSNGASLWVMELPSLPLVTMVIEVPGGSSLDARGKEGAAALAGRLLQRGAGGRDATAFAAEVERLGAQLDISTTRHSSSISVSVHKDRFPEALALVSDMVLAPTFRSPDLRLERKLAIADISQELEDPGSIAARLGYSLYFGAGTAWGRPVDGTAKTVASIRKSDVVGYHAKVWSGGSARITLAGDITLADATKALEGRLGQGWPKGTPAPTVVPTPNVGGDPPIYIVDRPGSAQTAFLLLFPGPALGAAEEAPATLGTIALGGTFTSRLNALLREKRGYTYGVRARVNTFPGVGVLSISTRIRTDVTAAAMTDLVAELSSIRNGVSPEEMLKARSAWSTDLVETMASREGVAWMFAPYHLVGLGPTTVKADQAELASASADSVKAAMAGYDPSKAVIVLVGDWAKIKEPLTNAGFTRTQLMPAL